MNHKTKGPVPARIADDLESLSAKDWSYVIKSIDLMMHHIPAAEQQATDAVFENPETEDPGGVLQNLSQIYKHHTERLIFAQAVFVSYHDWLAE